MLMNIEAHQKITTAHLSRLAYLYVRQSTLRQVLENTESTHRQYALRERAVALGWPLDRIIVIDSDLGQSGATAADREGFQRLVTEVSLGRVGIVLGLEVSRLARNSTDWHRLLALCALADTLILDEDANRGVQAIRSGSDPDPRLDDAGLHAVQRSRAGHVQMAYRRALCILVGIVPRQRHQRREGAVERRPSD